MKAGIVSRIDKVEALTLSQEIVGYLGSKGVEVVIETETALAMEMPSRNLDLTEMDTDFIVTVGGDGTILKTAMLIKEPNTPILGVNMGSRGFITEIYPEDIERAINWVLEKKYFIEECLKLSSNSPDIDGTFPDSLNEVLLSSSLPSKMLDMRLKIDGKHILDIQADGAIVSTPIGSTAYNLSAGGSIIAPELDIIILTMICPYSYFRSIVVPASSIISIEMLKPKGDALVIIDGREFTALKPQSSIKVWKSNHKARFIRFKPFYERLERRLVFKKVK